MTGELLFNRDIHWFFCLHNLSLRQIKSADTAQFQTELDLLLGSPSYIINISQTAEAIHGGKEEHMENENLQLEEEETSILTLTDENGQDVDFEYLDCIEYQGKEYLVLMPTDEPSTEIVILEVEPVDEENENYLSVSDEAILNAVYDIFKEKYKDILTFED